MEASSNLIIVDSSGLISLVVETDSNHEKAVAFAHRLESTEARGLVPAEVFAETLNILGKKFGHQYAAGTVQAVLENAAFVVVPTTDVSRLNAVKRFRAAAAGVSLTDCLVMQVADEYGTRDIFGFDATFAQEGYWVPTEAKKAA